MARAVGVDDAGDAHEIAALEPTLPSERRDPEDPAARWWKARTPKWRSRAEMGFGDEHASRVTRVKARADPANCVPIAATSGSKSLESRSV